MLMVFLGLTPEFYQIEKGYISSSGESMIYSAQRQIDNNMIMVNRVMAENFKFGGLFILV